MCVRRQERQRARSGRSRTVASASSRITRSRPCPTAPAAPSRTTGRPAARPPDRRRRQWHRRTTARQAFQITTATMPGAGHRAPGGARVAACPARRRPATHTAPDASKRHNEHRRDSRRRPGQHELPDAHGVIAQESRHQPPDPDRHAHAGRRQLSSTCSERTARNSPWIPGAGKRGRFAGPGPGWCCMSLLPAS